MTRNTLSNAIAYHASVARYGGEIGTRGPMVRWQDQNAPRWWSIPLIGVCCALMWAIVR